MMKLNLVPIETAPAQWKDGRQCLAVDFLGTWRVVTFDPRDGWVWYNASDFPFAPYPPIKENMVPVEIAAIEDAAGGADDVEA